MSDENETEEEYQARLFQEALELASYGNSGEEPPDEAYQARLFQEALELASYGNSGAEDVSAATIQQPLQYRTVIRNSSSSNPLIDLIRNSSVEDQSAAFTAVALHECGSG